MATAAQMNVGKLFHAGWWVMPCVAGDCIPLPSERNRSVIRSFRHVRQAALYIRTKGHRLQAPADSCLRDYSSGSSTATAPLRELGRGFRGTGRQA
jgi:hypothetical protein